MIVVLCSLPHDNRCTNALSKCDIDIAVRGCQSIHRAENRSSEIKVGTRRTKIPDVKPTAANDRSVCLKQKLF
eukprot:scaffold17049_cov175-Skeletonema_marinoi.AAC.1